MQKEYYWDNNPRCAIWDTMWTIRTIDQEVEACEIETPPRELFLKYLKKSDKVVDAGCGFAKWVIYLHNRGYDILGVDNNDLALAKLKEYDPTLQVESGDILNVDYPDSHFDAYISMGVVEHFEEGPQEPLMEAYRLVKPGGLIFVSVPTVNTVRRIYRPVLRRITYALLRSLIIIYQNWKKSKSWALQYAAYNLLPESIKKILAGKNPRYYHFTEYRYTREELEGFLKEAGFEVLEAMPHDFTDSRDHAIGLSLDFPFLRNLRGEPNFKLNAVGKVISCILNGISPWIACASVICVARSLKREDPK